MYCRAPPDVSPPPLWSQGAENQKYDEVPDIARLLVVIEEYLADYNAQVGNVRIFP
jgi:hypothetical protein